MDDLVGGLLRQFAAAIPSVFFALVAIAIAAYGARRFRLLGGNVAQERLDKVESKLIDRLETTAENLRAELAVEQSRYERLNGDFSTCKSRLDDAQYQVRLLTREMFELYRHKGVSAPDSLRKRLETESEVDGAG